MSNVRRSLQWVIGLTMVTFVSAAPIPVHAMECNAFVSVAYVGGRVPAVLADTERVRLTVFTGAIVSKSLNQLTVSRLRFDLDCSGDDALGLPCTDDGAVVKYQRNITSTDCFDATGSPVTFSDNSAPGSLTPNEVVFTASAPVVLNAKTSEAAGCKVEFDVQVNSSSHDSSPDQIEQVAGFRVIGGVPDAGCGGALTTVAQSSAIPLAAAAAPFSTVPDTTVRQPPRRVESKPARRMRDVK